MTSCSPYNRPTHSNYPFRISTVGDHVQWLGRMTFCITVCDVSISGYMLSSPSFLACNSGLRSAIRWHHPPQRTFLGHIHCFGERRLWCLRSCWTVLSHTMRRRLGCLLQSTRGEANRILFICTMCPNRISRHDRIIAVSLGWLVSLRMSSFRTYWCHLIPSNIRRHQWSSASILHASIFEIVPSEPYRNIGYMCTQLFEGYLS